VLGQAVGADQDRLQELMAQVCWGPVRRLVWFGQWGLHGAWCGGCVAHGVGAAWHLAWSGQWGLHGAWGGGCVEPGVVWPVGAAWRPVWVGRAVCWWGGVGVWGEAQVRLGCTLTLALTLSLTLTLTLTLTLALIVPQAKLAEASMAVTKEDVQAIEPEQYADKKNGWDMFKSSIDLLHNLNEDDFSNFLSVGRCVLCAVSVHLCALCVVCMCMCVCVCVSWLASKIHESWHQ